MLIVDSYEAVLSTLLDGGVGVLPTDTVYGLVARVHDKEAVRRLYVLKEREHKPGTVIAANTQQLLALGVQADYLQRVADLWPGPLSIETPLPQKLAYLHQDTGRQALRIVAVERLCCLLEKTGPLLTTSANHPGKPGATTLAQAQAYFTDKVDFYMEGGDLSGRPPSTIIRFDENGKLEVVRQGAIHIAPNCPFCLSNKLFKGEIFAESAGAFLAPAASHAAEHLIIPKQHVERVEDLPDTWWQEVKILLSKVSHLAGDYNISLNIGPSAGQTVKHLHFWVIGRKAGQPATGKGLARLIAEANNPSHAAAD